MNTLNEVVDGNTDVKNIFAKSVVGGGMTMGFGKLIKYQIAPYDGGKVWTGFQKYAFPAIVSGGFEMSEALIFSEYDKKNSKSK